MGITNKKLQEKVRSINMAMDFTQKEWTEVWRRVRAEEKVARTTLDTSKVFDIIDQLEIEVGEREREA